MPAVSGQFYPGTASGLSRALLALTREVKAPEPAIGVVVPHAGYVYSGAVAGDVFSSVRVPGRAVIFCPNHTGLGEDVADHVPRGVADAVGGRTRSTRSSPRASKPPAPSCGRTRRPIPAGACDRGPASVPSPVPAGRPHRPRRPRTPLPRGVPGARGERGGRDRGGRRTSPAGRQLRHVPLRARRRRAEEGPDGDRPDAGPRPRGALRGPSGPSGSRCAG